MSVDEWDRRLESLLLRWEELRDQGRSVSAENLCGGDSELAGKLARRIEALRRMGNVGWCPRSVEPF